MAGKVKYLIDKKGRKVKYKEYSKNIKIIIDKIPFDELIDISKPKKYCILRIFCKKCNMYHHLKWNEFSESLKKSKSHNDIIKHSGYCEKLRKKIKLDREKDKKNNIMFEIVDENSDPAAQLGCMRASQIAGQKIDYFKYEELRDKVIKNSHPEIRNLWNFLEETYDVEVCEIVKESRKKFRIYLRSPMGKLLLSITKKELIESLDDIKLNKSKINIVMLDILLKDFEKKCKTSALISIIPCSGEQSMTFNLINKNNKIIYGYEFGIKQTIKCLLRINSNLIVFQILTDEIDKITGLQIEEYYGYMTEIKDNIFEYHKLPAYEVEDSCKEDIKRQQNKIKDKKSVRYM